MSMNEVKSAKRILEILRFFAATRSPATLAQIAAGLKFPKSSCLALLDTLEVDGYAYQSAGRYYLTRRWLNESRIVAENDELGERVRPILESLQKELGETLIFAERSGLRVVYLEVVEAERTLRFAAQVGQTKPLHASASGRAILGTLSRDEREKLVSKLDLVRYTAATLVTPEALLKVVDKELRQGWHVNIAEHQEGTVSIAAAMVLHGSPFALVVGSPLTRVNTKVNQIGRTLMQACQDLTAIIEKSRTVIA